MPPCRCGKSTFCFKEQDASYCKRKTSLESTSIDALSQAIEARVLEEKYWTLHGGTYIGATSFDGGPLANVAHWAPESVLSQLDPIVILCVVALRTHEIALRSWNTPPVYQISSAVQLFSAVRDDSTDNATRQCHL